MTITHHQHQPLAVRLGAVLISATLLAAGGCATTNPYTGEQQTSKATKGAAVGAAVGALAGILSADSAKERRNRALIGAGVGAATGGGIGYYMDVQEAKLRAQLEGTGVSVTRVGDRIVLNMPSNITFRTGSADLNASFFPVLDSVALVLQEYDRTTVSIAGHTDSTGSEEFNQLLSEQRANAVARYLISRGIDGNRLQTRGYGERRPIADNGTAAGRAANRRVEVTLEPLPQ